jgi:hypothetical protein
MKKIILIFGLLFGLNSNLMAEKEYKINKENFFYSSCKDIIRGNKQPSKNEEFIKTYLAGFSKAESEKIEVYGLFSENNININKDLPGICKNFISFINEKNIKEEHYFLHLRLFLKLKLLKINDINPKKYFIMETQLKNHIKKENFFN